MKSFRFIIWLILKHKKVGSGLFYQWIPVVYHGLFTLLLVLYMLGFLLFILLLSMAAGFYICWGCLVWVPSIYTSPGMYLVNHPVNLGTQVSYILFSVVWLKYRNSATCLFVILFWHFDRRHVLFLIMYNFTFSTAYLSCLPKLHLYFSSTVHLCIFNALRFINVMNTSLPRPF